MLTGSNKDLQVTKHIQAEARERAAQALLAHTAQGSFDEPDQFAWVNKRRVVIIILLALALVTLFAGYQRAHAQDNVDAGKGEPFADAMLAYRVGSFHLHSENYDRAVEELTRAIALMPEWAFELEPGYAEMYWTLGEAQEGAGLYSEALASYEQFVTIAGEQAAPWTYEKVETLSAEVNAMLGADVQA